MTKKSTDSGTTASTDCSDSDHNSDNDKNVYNVPSSTVRDDVQRTSALRGREGVSQILTKGRVVA